MTGNFSGSAVFAAICTLIILRRYPGIARVAGVIRMFPKFKKLNNESGIVLFIVLMTAIIIMIFSAGILTQSMNEINYAQQQIDQIACDQLTKGTFWQTYATGMGAVSSVNFVLSGRTYTVDIPASGASSSPGIAAYTVNCSFDSFQ